MMSRAEYRRMNRIQKAATKEKNDELAEEILKMMLVIPTNVLIADFWPKSAKKNIPKFVDSCISLYQAWEAGAVSMTQMQELTEEYAKIKLVESGSASDKAIKERARRELE